MSVVVKIRNKQFFKKPLSINDLTLFKYSYGHLDDYFRCVDELIEGYNVLYDPNKIGRGIEFKWFNNLKDEIELRVNYLSTKYDIEMFYEVIRNIMHVWKAKTFEREGEECRESDIDGWCESDKNFNLDFLLEQEKNITIFGARFPIDIDFNNESIKSYFNNNDAEGYANYLNKLQSIDAYYAVPLVYRLEDNKFLGNYVITATVDTIFPKEAKDPLLFQNPDTGKQIECSEFTVSLVSLKEKREIGRIPFNEFIDKIRINEYEDFDGSHVLIKGFSEEELYNIAKT